MTTRSRINTGITQTIEVLLPRPTPKTHNPGGLVLKSGEIALHEGESPEQARMFATHITRVWEFHRANWSWGPSTGRVS